MDEPLLDAIGGSLAATLSVTAFYPLEVLRVHLQTNAIQELAQQPQLANELIDQTAPAKWKRIVELCQKVIFNKGAGLRLVHTQVTSFLFYGIYRQISKSFFRKKSAWSNVFASTSAAVIVVLLAGTPLDGMILRFQTQSSSGDETQTYVVAPPPKPFLQGILDLYNGVTPALLLCLNPAIHFSVYDHLKLLVLNASPVKGPVVTYENLNSHPLTAAQAFLVGAIAKGIATIACYPLLRAKVSMMTSIGVSSAEGVELSPSDSDFLKLFKTLYLIVQVQGFGGLYRGIMVHFFHTTMRSALSMMLKEKIISWLKGAL